MKRRGINLKFLEERDPGLVELLTSDLCHPETEEAEAFDPFDDCHEPDFGDVADEIQEGLEQTLRLLDEGLAAAGHVPRDPESTAPQPPAKPRKKRPASQLFLDFE